MAQGTRVRTVGNGNLLPLSAKAPEWVEGRARNGMNRGVRKPSSGRLSGAEKSGAALLGRTCDDSDWISCLGRRSSSITNTKRLWAGARLRVHEMIAVAAGRGHRCNLELCARLQNWCWTAGPRIVAASTNRQPTLGPQTHPRGYAPSC
jgi:hypothetical protein